MLGGASPRLCTLHCGHLEPRRPTAAPGTLKPLSPPTPTCTIECSADWMGVDWALQLPPASWKRPRGSYDPLIGQFRGLGRVGQRRI